MTAVPLLFLVIQAISWVSVIVTFGGLMVCLSNQRFLPKLRLMSLGFAGLVLSGIWNRVGVHLLAQAGFERRPLSTLYLINGLVQVISMGLLVYGLSAVLSDFRRRLSRKDEPLDEIV